MKTSYQYLILSCCLISIIFGCQSDTATNPFVETGSKRIDSFYLDIALPETDIEAPLRNKTAESNTNVYLKTATDRNGIKSHILSINKTKIPFDEFNKFFNHNQHNSGIPKNQNLRQVTNLYIDKTAPYYLVDYIQKKLAASAQFRLSFVNKKGQRLQFNNPIPYQQIWDNKTTGPTPPLPPPPPPLPRTKEESDAVFSKNYLATLKQFGIDQEAVPNSSPEHMEHYSIHSKNIFEIILNADNQLILGDSLVSLDEALLQWHLFMKDKKSWRKRITACYISGKANYGDFFEFYASIRSAFQQKRNLLANDMFGKNIADLDRASKKMVYSKLPLVIITELDD